jgi:hypothetical protein
MIKQPNEDYTNSDGVALCTLGQSQTSGYFVNYMFMVLTLTLSQDIISSDMCVHV